MLTQMPTQVAILMPINEETIGTWHVPSCFCSVCFFHTSMTPRLAPSALCLAQLHKPEQCHVIVVRRKKRQTSQRHSVRSRSRSEENHTGENERHSAHEVCVIANAHNPECTRVQSQSHEYTRFFSLSLEFKPNIL